MFVSILFVSWWSGLKATFFSFFLKFIYSLYILVKGKCFIFSLNMSLKDGSFLESLVLYGTSRLGHRDTTILKVEFIQALSYEIEAGIKA